jgi:uncharacterized protein (DUF433 family)
MWYNKPVEWEEAFMTETLLGVGIYTIPEASRLLKLESQTIRRWIKGYTYNSKEEKRIIGPLITSSLPVIDNKFVISFLELMELYVVKKFLSLRISLPKIRVIANRASEILEIRNPLAHHLFKIMGKSVFLECKTDKDDTSPLELFKNQFALKDIVKDYLLEIDFNEIDFPFQALRWYPMGREKSIVLDPQICFGEPTIEHTRIPVESIYTDFLGEKSVNRVASWFGIDKDKAQNAISFMESLKVA